MAREGAIQLIVEGPGDRGAVPVLLRRVLDDLVDFRPNLLASPIAVNGLGNLTKPGGIEGYIRIAAARSGARAVMVVVDSDGECIKKRAQALMPRCHGSAPVVVVIAENDFEDWIYASAETTLPGVEYAVGSSGSAMIKRSQKYTKSVDQARLAAKIDLDLARSRSRSFDRLIERFITLVNAL